MGRPERLSDLFPRVVAGLAATHTLVNGEPPMTDPVPLHDLTCPYCGSEVEVEMETRGRAYTSYEEPVAIACENTRCWARWNPQTGKLLTPPERSEGGAA